MDRPRIIELPKFLDERGNLSFVENNAQIPFTIKRTYWLYDVPGGVNRGGHAEKNNEELIIAMSGSFDIIVDDGEEARIFTLHITDFISPKVLGEKFLISPPMQLHWSLVASRMMKKITYGIIMTFLHT